MANSNYDYNKYGYNKYYQEENTKKDRNLSDFTSASDMIDKDKINSKKNKSNSDEDNILDGTSFDNFDESDDSYPDSYFDNGDFSDDNDKLKESMDILSSNAIDVPEKLKEVLFPYEKVRIEQERLIIASKEAFDNKKHLIAHAPTGLGKTVSVLAPALNYAIRNDKKIIFLTSRHTQHLIAMKTANEIKEKYKINFIATDIIGKKWMCLNSSAKNANSSDFSEICKYLRNNNRCKYYQNTRRNNGLTPKASLVIDDIKRNINSTIKILEVAEENELCPYELSLELAKESHLIVADYYYVFNEDIMGTFFKKCQISLNNCLLIVDEGHNLPNRIREQQTVKLSTFILNRAIKEAKNLSDENLEKNLNIIKDILVDWAKDFDEQTSILKYQREENLESLKEDSKENTRQESKLRDNFESEALVRKEDFEFDLKRKIDLQNAIENFYEVGSNMKSIENTVSYIYSVAQFLDKWKNTTEESFIRILKKDSKNITLFLRCLDPCVTSKDIISESHSTILMSGTLKPTTMYRDILGFDEDRTVEMYFENPFPKRNRFNLIIPKTTTKYEMRGIEQFINIANICSDIINRIPGNSIVFFPSYDLLKKVYHEMKNVKKTMIFESSGMTRDEKFEILEKFKSYHTTGACLFAVQSGSFSEGIDLPGDYLKAVIVIGLPLQKPDLETRQLINYFDNKFSKGWDYGYVFPAFSKIMQSAGRCIRSENDKGIILFVDERYSWPNYIRCFPDDWDMKISLDYNRQIENFFKM